MRAFQVLWMCVYVWCVSRFICNNCICRREIYKHNSLNKNEIIFYEIKNIKKRDSRNSKFNNKFISFDLFFLLFFFLCKANEFWVLMICFLLLTSLSLPFFYFSFCWIFVSLHLSEIIFYLIFVIWSKRRLFVCYFK